MDQVSAILVQQAQILAHLPVARTRSDPAPSAAQTTRNPVAEPPGIKREGPSFWSIFAGGCGPRAAASRESKERKSSGLV